MKDLDALKQEVDSDLRAAREGREARDARSKRDAPILAAFDRLSGGHDVPYEPGPRHATRLTSVPPDITDEVITAYRDEDGADATTIAVCNLALGHLTTEREIDEAIATLREGEDWWFRSLTRDEARGEVLTRINAARAREAAQEAADDAANRRAGDAYYEALSRVSHYIDGDPEDR